jgi:molybdate-binding protein/transcriptional regulator with XRE-family HTH domain
MNAVRAARDRLGWSQRELSERAGLSRTEISAIETDRVVPSAAIAIRVARALGSSVEALFGEAPGAPEWAWQPASSASRYWEAVIAGRRWRVPCEPSLVGLTAHDAARSGLAEQTLVVAGCDPAIGLFAAPLRERGIRLVAVTRSSRDALALLAAGRVHVAGVHLGGTRRDGNPSAVRAALGVPHRLLRMAIWEEGLALASGSAAKSRSPRALARLRWASRASGSGARECMDQLLEGARPATEKLAADHREVASAIRSGWAEAGVCVRLAAAEAGLDFSPVRREAYDLCYPEALEGDRRLIALFEIARSRELRRTLGELPGYDVASTGELRVAP